MLRRILRGGIGLLVLAAPVAGQDNRNAQRGFDAESVYQAGEIDSIDLFSGSLSLGIPIGNAYPLNSRTSYGFRLVYNSDLWDYRNFSADVRIAVPTRVANAGLGWSFNPGYVLEENQLSDIPHEENHHQYVAPDGSQHFFYTVLHRGENDGDANSWYSRDNSYLRLRRLTGPVRYRVEFPGGEIHEFGFHEDVDPQGQNWQKWYLTRIEDRFGNWMEIDYGAAPPQGATWDWAISDSHGRGHSVRLTRFADIGAYYVTEVSLDAFGTLPSADYTFTYAAATIDQGCAATFPMENVAVRLLTRVMLPSGETYDMTDDAGDPRYSDGCGSRESGVIEGIRLPTRGQIEWQWAKFQLPRYFTPPYNPNNGDVAAVDVYGVRQRRTLEPDSTVIGRWNYVRELDPALPTIPGDDPSVEQRVHVEDPLGHCTTHYFDANTGNWDQGPNPYPGWSYGLPFSWDQPRSGDQYLSTRVHDGSDLGLCGGPGATLLRSTYVAYEHDELPPGPATTPGGDLLLEPWHQSDRRVHATRTVYHDDGDRFAATAWSDFDGLGHHRTSTTEGDFAAGNVRQATTSFNPDVGTYEVNQDTNETTSTITPPAPSEPWLLETFDERTVTEAGQTEITKSCFDADGFLTHRRVYLGADVGTDDVLTVFAPDSEGNVASERWFGGDAQHVAAVPDLCGLDPATPAYEIRNSYSHGVLSLSQYFDDGVALPFTLVRDTIDPSTGLVSASRDGAGLRTDYLYDAMGRLTDAQPEAGHGAWVHHAYVNATSTSNARVETEYRANGGGAVLDTRAVELDGLGRRFREERQLPSGFSNHRETLYNARGDRESVSQFGFRAPSPFKTTYSEYDPFGRPGRITPPDGAAHDVTLTYSGVRRVERTRQVAGQGAVEAPATFTEIYDRQGRLHQLLEPSEVAGVAETTTTYGYDAGSRLTSVSMHTLDANLLGQEVTQTRLFDYDPRGFLASETHPELGFDPGDGTHTGGTIFYDDYDALGNVGRLVDDRRTLEYAYDAAGRLETVSSPGVGTLKSFTYDDTATTTHGRGKLHQAIRHNRTTLPAGGSATIVVTETFDYDAVGGRVSQVHTANSHNGLEFATSQTYDDLGRVKDREYPACEGTDCPVADPLTVRHTYGASYLTAVGTSDDESAFASILYHGTNGLWSNLQHGNGVTTIQANDSNHMLRPRFIRVSGIDLEEEDDEPFDTGNYAYDGSGNVKAMGTTDVFEYDSRSRLAFAEQHGWEQTFTYDDFGNIERICTKSPSQQGDCTNLDPTVTTATNRLTNSDYDGSGNLTVLDRQQTWIQDYDLVNMARTRSDTTGATQWAAIYTASDERLATWDLSSGELEQRWTLRSPSGQALRVFRHGKRLPGSVIFEDGFESGDTSAWSTTVPFAGSPPIEGAQASNVGTATWSVETSYVYRGDALLADYSKGEIRHYHLDHLGSVRQITNSVRGIAATQDFLPYGEEVGGSTNKRQFTGHERDSHLSAAQNRYDDLDYMHARYCMPHLGRFVNVDPKARRRASNMPQRWNRYSYVAGNPLKYVDPDGQDLTIFINPARSNLDLNAQLRLGAGVRQRFVNAGVENVRVVFRRRDVPTAVVGKHKVVDLRFVRTVQGKEGHAMGKTNAAQSDSLIATSKVPANPDKAMTHLINVLTHEAGHQAAGLATFAGHTAPKGTVMAQPTTDAEMHSQGILEFSPWDAADLRRILNEDPDEHE